MPRHRLPSPPVPPESAARAGGESVSSPSAPALKSEVGLGRLYLVSTPIGNLEDITLRALRVLRSADLIAAEDVRVTRRLLAHFAITTELIAYRPRAQGWSHAPILDCLRAGRCVALVSDAGTPAIADPGEALTRAALHLGADVIPVPGPVAALGALVASGLPTGRFAFDGFPPRARADRHAFFAALAHETRTILLYETSAHLRATLDDLIAALGPQRPVVLACDLTRQSEHLFRGTLAEVARLRIPRGEITLVVAGIHVLPSE